MSAADDRAGHRRFQWHGILSRIVLLCFFAVVLALGLFGVFILQDQRNNLERRLESTAQIVATSIEQVSMNSIVLEDYSTVIDHCLKVVRDRPLVLYLVVTRPNGDSFVHQGDGWTYRQLQGWWQPDETPRAGFVDSELAGQRVYHYAHSFSYAQIQGGWIHVGLSTEAFEADLDAIYWRTILLALVCMGVVLVLSLLYARRLSSPIRQLDAITREVAAGDLEVRADIVGGGGEVERLARSFNQMTEALAKARRELEQRVDERTGELREANRQLQLEIEERRQTERELVRLERLRALGEMSAGVSHNLNNLLVGIIGPSEMLLSDLQDPDSQELVRMIHIASRRAADLVQRLHKAVQVESEVALEPVSVDEVVAEAVHTTRPRWKDEAQARGVQVEVVVEPGDPPPIRATQDELHHVLVNLIFNAVDALPKGGTVTLRTWQEGDEVRLSVRDTGIGMDEETSRRIFEPFFTTKKDVGTGLGLSTVYGSVNRWGGRIEVASRPGEGTAFELSFPLWAGDYIAEGEGGPVTVRGRRLLFIDDEVMVIKLLERLFGAENEVRSFYSGESALADFAPGYFDAVLVDLGLQSMSGDEVARRLREVDASLAIVLITGWKLEEDDPRLAAFDFYLHKPFGHLQRVQTTVQRAVELHQQRSET